MTQENKDILCIDDDNDTCELVKFVLEQKGLPVTACNTADEGLLYARKGTFSLIILDNRFHMLSGIEVCERIREFDKETPVVFFTGESRQTEIDKAMSAGATAYLIKPNDFEKLAETVLNLI
ncbi:MAG: DNA-binding response regulator [Acidobacteria bacterium]|jgi:CheY-like chemotaxis protein|nr:DNA-binding response regulator [Acidobacteriota bacterium]